jgi:hypothetical protein
LAHVAPEMVMLGVEGLITYWKGGGSFKKCLKRSTTAASWWRRGRITPLCVEDKCAEYLGLFVPQTGILAISCRRTQRPYQTNTYRLLLQNGTNLLHHDGTQSCLKLGHFAVSIRNASSSRINQVSSILHYPKK